MIVECPYCETSVDGKLLAEHSDPEDPEFGPAVFEVSLLECPRCKNTLVAGELLGEGDAPSRLWPPPEGRYSSDIPEIARTSLEEAQACFKVRAYSACAVMCGRTLEGICRHFKTQSQYLGGGLKELRERSVIDGRLLEWAQELQKSRNLSAHATGEKVSQQDARDLLDFTRAICEYTFVLSAKFEVFMERRKKPPAP